MKILLIDDDRVLDHLPEGAEFYIARTSADAVQVLSQVNNWDEIWFDHDLSGDDDTMKVVDYIGLREYKGDRINIGAVYVHSGNRVGADNVIRAMKARGYQVKKVSILGNLSMTEDEVIFNRGYLN